MQEFLGAVCGNKVKCAYLTTYGENYEHGFIKNVLKANHNEAEYSEFLNSLNFEYDSGYGTQNLYGVIWLENGTWFSRAEYDGSEWWQHHHVPEIPDECL
jgi:hypothetical protein